jgi:hypothetical protein
MRRITLLVVPFVATMSAYADVTLNGLFTDHMVLQRDIPVESGDNIRIVCSREEHLRHPDAQDFGTMMQRHENTGRPFGDKAFVRKLESLLGRPLLPGLPGRPRKTGE